MPRSPRLPAGWLLPFLLVITSAVGATIHSFPGDGGNYYDTTYAPSGRAGELIYAAQYTLWIPKDVARLRGIIVHVHGCGINPTKYGHMAAYDLQWQALARKWDCALLGPSFLMTKPDDPCTQWCDPRNGSDRSFLTALADLSRASGHAELQRVPWTLWGHSGGGSWVSIMQMLHPERIVAIWFRSGSAYPHWITGEWPKVRIPPEAMEIPMMCNSGVKERGDKRYGGGWENPMTMFKAYRAAGAPIGFAADPLTQHACGDSRYLAIPFFDACLGLRLPPQGSATAPLRKIDLSRGWLAPLLGSEASPAKAYPGPREDSVWLPDARVAKAWAEFERTGEVNDSTPPPAPTQVAAKRTPDGTEITWSAEPDFESGLRQFIVERDGREIGRVPDRLATRFGRGTVQGMSSWDTPLERAPALRFVDRTPGANVAAAYRVRAVNTAGWESR